MFTPLEKEIEATAKEIVDIAVMVHKELGPGLLESVYEKCFCFELSERGILFKKQVCLDVLFNNKLVVEDALKIDILIKDEVVVELKAQDNYHPIWEAQLLSYLKLSQKRLGFLINFHVPLMKNGIKRIIL